MIVRACRRGPRTARRCPGWQRGRCTRSGSRGRTPRRFPRATSPCSCGATRGALAASNITWPRPSPPAAAPCRTRAASRRVCTTPASAWRTRSGRSSHQLCPRVLFEATLPSHMSPLKYLRYRLIEVPRRRFVASRPQSLYRPGCLTAARASLPRLQAIRRARFRAWLRRTAAPQPQSHAGAP